MPEQRLSVFVEISGAERAPSAHVAVALGHVADPDAFDSSRDQLTIEHAEESVQRPDPAQLARAPGHRLRPGKLRNDRLGQFGEDFRGRPADASDDGEPRAVAHSQGFAGHPGGPKEAVKGGVGRADAWTLALVDAVGLKRWQAVDHQRQTTRAGEGAQGIER